MHLFRTSPLIAKLAANKVRNIDKAYYLVVSFVLFNVVYYSGLATGNPVWTIPSLLEGLSMVVINLVGIVKAYDAAGGDRNNEFITEFTCLYVPISVTTVLPIWALYWAVTEGFRESLIALSDSHMQFAINLSRLGGDMFAFLTFAAAVSAQGITYLRLARSLQAVRELKPAG